MSLESETERISKNMARALAEIDRLRASHDRLLAAAWEALESMSPTGQAQDALRAAIAAAEKQAP